MSVVGRWQGILYIVTLAINPMLDIIYLLTAVKNKAAWGSKMENISVWMVWVTHSPISLNQVFSLIICSRIIGCAMHAPGTLRLRIPLTYAGRVRPQPEQPL